MECTHYQFTLLRECEKLMDACKKGEVKRVVEQLEKKVSVYHTNAKG